MSIYDFVELLTDDSQMVSVWDGTKEEEAFCGEARCGWYGIAYAVCDIDGENRTEFVLMFAEPNDTPNGARWINVTGDSKGAIAEAVWSLVFA